MIAAYVQHKANTPAFRSNFRMGNIVRFGKIIDARAACSFAVAEGIVISHDGGLYVLIRKANRVARDAEMRVGFIVPLVPPWNHGESRDISIDT